LCGEWWELFLSKHRTVVVSLAVPVHGSISVGIDLPIARATVSAGSFLLTGSVVQAIAFAADWSQHANKFVIGVNCC
jgi:hypothetical protein